MMKRWMRALLCLCLLLPLGAKAEGPFSHVFVFGDSLSDTGNAAKFLDLTDPTTVGLCPLLDFPCDDIFFKNSRVSNGPVAVERLAELLGFDDLGPSFYFMDLPPFIFLPFPRPTEFGTNYAAAGARAGGSALADLNAQLSVFLADHPVAPSDALYVFFIGGNDVRDARSALEPSLMAGTRENMISGRSALVSPLTAGAPEEIITNAVGAIDVSIRELIGKGARKFLVVNAPNIASLPETRIAAEALGPLLGPIFVLRTIQLTKQFNQQLAERLDQIRAEQMDSLVKIKGFNFFLFFEGVRVVGKLLGVFENIRDACFNSALYQASGNLENVFDPPFGHPDCDPGVVGEPPKFDDFVFFDTIHPTGQAHRIVGKALSRATRKLSDQRRHSRRRFSTPDHPMRDQGAVRVF